MSWYPKTAIGSGLLEALVVHHDPFVDDRMLKLIRLQPSFAVACPFCIDMNSFEQAKYGITQEEIIALQDRTKIDTTKTFSSKEKVALEYAWLISHTPLSFSNDFVETLKTHFSQRDIVILAGTAAQVNYWARLIQALGSPPMGYTERCEINHSRK